MSVSRTGMDMGTGLGGRGGGGGGSEYVRPPRSTFLGQLWTMLGRNILLKRGSIKLTIAEIFIPGIFLMEFVLLGVLTNKFNTAYPAIPEFTEQPLSYPGFPNPFFPQSPLMYYPVACVPDTAAARNIMNLTATYWNAMNKTSHLYTLFFPSEEEMVKFYLNTSTSFPVRGAGGAGIVFEDREIKTLRYTLRYPSELMPPTSKPYIRDNIACRPLPDKNKTSGNSTLTPGLCYANAYAYTGFASLQNVLAAAFAKINFGIDDGPLLLSTKMIPEGPTKLINGGAAVASMPANYMSQLLSFYVIFLVIYVVTEKEKKHIASMEIMGLRPAVYWLSWVILYLILMLSVSLIALVLANVLSIWPKSSFPLLLIDCMLYGSSVIALGFCMAPLFRRPLVAGLMTYALMTVFGFLYLLETFIPNMSDAARWAMAILSPTAFFMSMARVSQAEANGFGIGFGNAMGDHNSFSFGYAIIMLTADLIIYSLLAVYLEKVFPSDDSPKQKAWFFLLPSYWCPSRSADPFALGDDSSFGTADIEEVPAEVRARVAISTHGLRKVFRGKTDAVAVHGFSYEMYEDEILAILGHNGAGKTTLINMLTGMLAPTSGTASVYGNDISNPDQLEVARTMIGICPQHDVLFDTFTVRQHIAFYARLKGFSKSYASIEFERIVDQIGLRTHADVQAQKLSGGQKRRLSIAIACVGNPKILILDEPTSGVDPYSRRFLWDMIREYRKGRCIIITTQSMQEADVFADRKLIMAHGKLRCAGTSLFLKNRFGLGYHLTMSVDRDFNEAQVEEFVTSRVAGAEKARAHAGEISFVLPKAGVGSFPALFNELDHNLPALKVQTYGVSLTTMEEIFLKLADDDVAGLKIPGGELKKGPLPERRDYSQLASTTFAKTVKGSVSNWTKFLALCKVRFLLLLRSKLFFIFQILIPFMLLLMNGILSELAEDFVSQFTSTDMLSIDKLTGEFGAPGVNFVYANQSGSDMSRLTEAIEREGTYLEHQDYADLLLRQPHYAGFIFKNTSTDLNGSVNAASILYNGSATHAIPFATNLLLNAVFRLRTGSNETFQVSSHPFPSAVASSSMLATAAFGSMLVGMAVSMIPGVYGIDVCRDRQLKIRSQIRMTGCSFWLYWGSAFVVHLIQFSLSFAMIIALLYAFNVTAVTDAIGCILVLFALHGPAMVLFSYCASFLFKKFETAAIGLPFPMTMIAFISFFVVLMLDAFDETSAAFGLHCFFGFVFPFYGFFGAMVYIQKIGVENAITAARGGLAKSYFDWNSNIPIIYLAHAIQIPLLILLLIYLESKHFNQSWLQFFGFRRVPPTGEADFTNVVNLAQEDDDVQKERNRVKGMNLFLDSSYAIVLRSLWKRFDTRSSIAKLLSRLNGSRVPVVDKIAVKNISLVFPKGEVFGLLGPNGAGKTTTLSMITGEVTPTSGDIHVNGFNMHTQTLSAIETMGSCPQSDTLWDDITMEEHLNLFAILNDLPPSRSQDSIKIFSEGLCITEHMGKKAAALSGGTKRKLTFVISMIGNPPLVLLDEPSTGMDPQSKRNLWDMIMQSFGGTRGAILTTHSMEEADALCDRIGIIIRGEMQCIGSSQHLKDKFGSGYMLEMKLSLPSGVSGAEHKAVVDRLKAEIVAVLPSAACVEEFYNRFVFAVPKEQITSLGMVFAELDRVKQLLNLEEYSFGQTTIEQVFLHFAKMQDVPDVPLGVQPFSPA